MYRLFHVPYSQFTSKETDSKEELETFLLDHYLFYDTTQKVYVAAEATSALSDLLLDNVWLCEINVIHLNKCEFDIIESNV